MKRRLFNLAAAVSLVLCVATVALWARSYIYDEGLSYRSRYDSSLAHWAISINSARGTVRYVGRKTRYLQPASHMESDAEGLEWWSEASGFIGDATLKEKENAAQHFLGAAFMRERLSVPNRADVVHQLFVPYWWLLAIAMVAPSSWVARAIRLRHRPSAGSCAACGYDLRGTPDRCPECGAVPAAKMPA